MVPETSLPLAHTLFTSKRPSMGLGSRKNLDTVKRLAVKTVKKDLEFPTISPDPPHPPSPPVWATSCPETTLARARVRYF